MASMAKVWSRARPYVAVIFMQFGIAGLAIIAKSALNNGMSNYSFVVYRQAVAAVVISPFAFVLERKVRPQMTLSIFIKILGLGLLEPVIDQNLYYAGMKYTTATFVSALSNTVPALTFLLAWMFRFEVVNKKVPSLAKVGGTIVTIGGATIMTLVKGPGLNMPWSNGSYNHHVVKTVYHQNPIKGAIMITSGCMGWAGFVILQAITLKSYPAEMSLTALMCFAGAIEGTIVAFVAERNTSIWALDWDSKLFAYIYSGVICSGIGFYLQGKIMKEKGPVFVTAFNPLSMVIVAFLGSFVLAEQLTLGRIAGAIVIVMGLYIVIWGKSKDEKEQTLPIIESPDSTISTITDNANVANDLGIIKETPNEA
ncbi:WAT1-related protein At2g39510-like [Chenopodium quinoa]|uniref:WAT1-related protein n=1 Tax=Chenopodium quinoa TaxID=63459 RepID=A0A803N5S0_CHEQI|nr:WAT1-related protein At2g39510-like [Chenopodium quinoa]